MKPTEQPTLIIMAAGMGSRYGGLKQVDKITAVSYTHLDVYKRQVYDKQNERKIEIYHGMGFQEHTNLILTTEEDIENPGVLDGIIERFLLS